MRPAALLVALFLLLAWPGLAEPFRSLLRYPPELAAQLVSEDEVKAVTESDVRLGEAAEPPATLLVSRPIPLSDLGVAAESKPRLLKPRGSQWDMPPFPEIDPPPPANLPPAARELWSRMQAQSQSGPTPTVFADLPSSASKPSALLRPKPMLAGQRRLTSEDLEIPPAFSARRYQSKDSGFFQVLVYGGSNSFDAEDAYRALKHAAPVQESLAGLGREAFLTHVVAPDYVAPAPPPDPAAMPLDDLPVVGRPRPDLLDPSVVRARSAPAFPSIALPPKPAARKPKPAAAKVAEPPKKPEVILLVFFLPEKSVTVELALDDRIGTVQHLIALGFIANQKLLQQW